MYFVLKYAYCIIKISHCRDGRWLLSYKVGLPIVGWESKQYAVNVRKTGSEHLCIKDQINCVWQEKLISQLQVMHKQWKTRSSRCIFILWWDVSNVWENGWKKLRYANTGRKIGYVICWMFVERSEESCMQDWAFVHFGNENWIYQQKHKNKLNSVK